MMDWMRVNKLKLNPDKTEMLLVGASPDKLEGHFPALNGVTLPLRDRVRSLGVLLNSGLTLEAQVDSVARPGAPSFSCGNYTSYGPTWTSGVS